MPSFVAIDFETGDSVRDSAIAVGLVRVDDGVITDERRLLIRPPQDAVRFTFVHGIRWSDVADQPRWAQRWPEVRGVLDGVDFLAAHNAAFDRGVLNASCQGAGIAVPTTPFLCTVKLARRAWSLPRARLPDVAAHLGVPLQHHDPLSDARVCAQIVLAAPELAAAMLQATPPRGRRQGRRSTS